MQKYCFYLLLAFSGVSFADTLSFKEKTQSYQKARPPSSELIEFDNDSPWQLVRHRANTDKEYYEASSRSTDAYMTLSVLFTPSKSCGNGKTFIAIKLADPAPFSARKAGAISVRFDQHKSTSSIADYILTKGSHIIWVDMPDRFLSGVKRFNHLNVRVDDYIQGQPSRDISLQGSQKALQKAQSFCYQLLRR